MQQDPVVEALNERIKELTCMYEISNIAANYSLSLENQLQSIVDYLPKAWRYPDHSIAELNIDSKIYLSKNLPKLCSTKKCRIIIDEVDRGYLAIHYDARQHGEAAFLSEEQTLLNTLGQEISRIVSRSDQQAREDLMNRKLQQSDRLAILGEITAGIAHELNTPIGNILGFSQFISDKTNDNQIKQDIDKIINSAIHSREVVKKLMFFACEIPQQMNIVPVVPLIKEALSLLKVTISHAKVRILLTTESNDIKAKLDPVQFTQVVFNLLINAIHASKPEMEISINLSSDEKGLRMSIEDKGHGMTNEVKEKIFQPFFSTKPTGEGSGLGLSVVHGIITSHGGEIRVDSEPDKGTIFSVHLPAK